MSEQEKKPRLFYWEDAESSWCVAGDELKGLLEGLVNNELTSASLQFRESDNPDIYHYNYMGDSETLEISKQVLECFLWLEILEDSERELMVKVECMTDAEYDALPED